MTNLARIAAFTTVENKKPNFSDLVKKADYDARISEMEKNILVILIIISSRVIHMTQRGNTKKLKSNQFGSKEKIKALATKEKIK